MPGGNSWEAQYKLKKHRAALKNVKSAGQYGGGGGKRGGKGLAAAAAQGGHGIADSLSTLQSALEATEAIIDKLKAQPGMSDEQAETLASLEEEAESLRAMLPNIDAVSRKVTEKLDAAGSAISTLREQTKSLQKQVTAAAPAAGGRNGGQAVGPKAGEESIEDWLDSFEIAFADIEPHLQEFGVEKAADLLELDADDIASIQEPLKKVQQRKFQRAIESLGGLSSERGVGSGGGRATGKRLVPTHAVPDIQLTPVQRRKMESQRKAEDVRNWKLGQETERRLRLDAARENTAFTRQAEAARKREEMRLKEDSRKVRVAEQKANERCVSNLGGAHCRLALPMLLY